MEKPMSEKIKLSVTVPENLTGIANRFLQSITFPTPKPDGGLSPPSAISVEQGSKPLGDYFIESLKIRPLGIDTGGSPRATVVDVVAVPVNKFVYTGPRGEDVLVACLKCGGRGRVRKVKPMPENYSPLTQMLHLQADVDAAEKDLIAAIENFDKAKGIANSACLTWVALRDAAETVKEKRRIFDAALDARPPPPEFTETSMTKCSGCGHYYVGDKCHACDGTGKAPENEAEQAGPKVEAVGDFLPIDGKIVTDFQLFDGLNRITPEAIKATEGKLFDFVDAYGSVYRGTIESVEVDPSGDFANLTLDIPGGMISTEVRPFLGIRAMVAVKDSPPSIIEYPREVVCLGCKGVVAYARATVVPEGRILASEVIRTDGAQPKENDPICWNCGESSMGIFRLSNRGPFWLRDRKTGEWIGGDPYSTEKETPDDGTTDEP